MDQETVGIIATIDDDSSLEKQYIGHEFRLRSGVVLSLRKVGPTLIQRALDGLKEPEIPTFYIEDKETWEENPIDPDYLEAMHKYFIRRGLLVQDIMLARGTEIKSMPEGVVGPNDDSWIADAEFLGIAVTNKDSKVARHLQWLYYVLDTVEELQGLVLSVQAYNNLISEEQVLQEMYYFRHPEERPKLNVSNDTEETDDRRDVSEFSTRDGVGVRAEGSSELRFSNLVTVPENVELKPHEAHSSL